MTALTQLLTQIKPCDTARPYIFISYSSADSETVWQDVLRFQQDGYNIWLDERNLDKTKESWKIDARRAISSRYCQLILFYVSATSLCSEPCLQELKTASSEQTKDYHNDKAVPILAVDVEKIDDITLFCDQVYRRLYHEIRDETEFEQKARTLRSMMKSLFRGKNNRVRILARRVPDRKLDYYEDIRQNFGAELRPLPPEPGRADTNAGGPLGPEPTAEAPAQAAEAVIQPAPEPGAATDLHTVKTLGTTDIKYHICTFGSALHIGFGAPVTVVMGGTRYERKMHNATKGRVDGMKQLYADHGLKLGDVLDSRYSASEHTIYLTKLDAEP